VFGGKCAKRICHQTHSIRRAPQARASERDGKKLGERRRREQTIVMESRQTLNKEEEYMPEAVIVSAVRTPIGRANKGVLKEVRGDDLAAFAVKAAVERVPKLDRSLIEDVIIGCAFPEGEQGMNVARIASLRAGLPV